MGNEFVDLFDRWAQSYDSTVSGLDEEYKDVFENYETILQEVASRVDGFIIEFGPGTGNLTKRLLSKQNTTVLAVEPSEKMREKANLKVPKANIVHGDFLQFPTPKQKVDGIVSTYAFHHLTDEEKLIALKRYHSLLQDNGKIVFADTVFLNDAYKQEIIFEAKNKGYEHLIRDLQSEYYTTIPKMTHIFDEAGFHVKFRSMNKFVWIFEATKKLHK